jgi:hypothetical protein
MLFTNAGFSELRQDEALLKERGFSLPLHFRDQLLFGQIDLEIELKLLLAVE